MRRPLIDAIRAIIDTLTLEEHVVLMHHLTGTRFGAITADTVTSALAEAGGNVTRAANVLGVARRTLQNRMREFNIDVRGGRPKL